MKASHLGFLGLLSLAMMGCGSEPEPADTGATPPPTTLNAGEGDAGVSATPLNETIE